MTVSNTVCAAPGCGEAAEHPMHHGEDKDHDYVPGESGMRQYAPFPDELADLVATATYRHGWRFFLDDIERDKAGRHSGAAGGLTLRILVSCINSYGKKQKCETCGQPVLDYNVWHYFPVPAATYNRAAWARWLFDCILKVETHEAGEFFKVGKGRPFAPTHGPGDDPYVVHEYATDDQKRTRFTGEVAPA